MSNNEVKKSSIATSRTAPAVLSDAEYMFPAFTNDKVLLNKKKDRLPAMGWNSWNAFGSKNSEALTKAMADAIIDLELDKLGYKYVVLDDGSINQACRWFIIKWTVKFPSGFKSLSDYIIVRTIIWYV